MNRNETVTKAAVVRRGINQIAKHGVQFGLFPAEVMADAERDG